MTPAVPSSEVNRNSLRFVEQRMLDVDLVYILLFTKLDKSESYCYYGNKHILLHLLKELSSLAFLCSCCMKFSLSCVFL